jgi:4-hydroxybenzoate polyprenyltransferase
LTAIGGKFMSSIKLIYAYWRERYPVNVFLPFAILIAAAGSAAVGSLPTVRGAILGCVLAYTLVLVFRIVDDLADLRSDRLRHPGRVLVRASSVAPIVVVALAIAVADIPIMLSQPRPGTRIAVFGAISLFLGLWYHWRARLGVGPLAGAHVLLLKYPVISLLTCARWDDLTMHTALPSVGAIYLGLCIYEQVHDRAVRESRGAPWIFAAEVGILAGLPLLMLSTGGLLR